MKAGFLTGGGLIAIGLMLQLSVGPVVWSAFRFPINHLVFLGFLALVAAMFLLGRRVRAFRFLGTLQAAIPTLVYASVLTIIMGLTRQQPAAGGLSADTATEGTWLNNMLTFWPFVLIYAYMALILGVVILKQLKATIASRSLSTLRPSLLSHLGLFLAMTAATLGNADIERLRMITVVGETECRAMTAEGLIHEVPLCIELKRFIMETYDDGSPKRYASEIEVLTKSGEAVHATVDVNKPVEVEGWKIYQYDYDTQMGPQSQASVLELVYDPWLPLVYTGIYMMLGGAVWMFVRGGRRNSKLSNNKQPCS